MKQNKRLVWLFLLPLLLPVVVWGLRHVQNNQIHNYDVGGFKNSNAGERAALKKLDEVVRNGESKGRLRVSWSVVTATSAKEPDVWLYGIMYEPFNERLIKYTLSPRYRDPHQAYVEEYVRVQQKFIRLISSQNGLLEDMKGSGAILKKQGVVDWRVMFR